MGKPKRPENLFGLKHSISEKISEESAGFAKTDCWLGSFKSCGNSVLTFINFFFKKN